MGTHAPMVVPTSICTALLWLKNKKILFSPRYHETDNSLTSPLYNESIIASFWIPYSRFTHWHYHDQCFKLQDQLFSSALRDKCFFLSVADTESVTGVQCCFGTGNAQRCQRRRRTYAVTAATAALVKTLKPVGPRDFYLTLIRFIDYTTAQRQKSFQSHTPAENPGEMWAGTLTHTKAFPHSLETYQRPVTTAMEGARPTPHRRSFHLCTCLTAPANMNQQFRSKTTCDVDLDYCIC